MELAEVIHYGLCGPTGDKSYKGIDSLPKTHNDCRIKVNGNIPYSEKRNNLPVLIIDEFNPSDFDWKKDYSLFELEQEMGDAFLFFNALTGEAHSGDGFVAFLGTKSKAVARALHKIDGGSKAALARSTTIDPSVGKPFSDWRGIQWSFIKELKKSIRQQGLAEDEVGTRTADIIREVCCNDNRNIRECCEKMQEQIDIEDERHAVIMSMGTVDGSPTRKKCWERLFCGSE